MEELEKRDKRIEFRFYLIAGLLIISVIIGLVHLFKEERRKEKKVKEEISIPTSLKIFRGRKKGVAIIRVYGTIQFSEEAWWGVESRVESIIRRINLFAEEKKVKGLVIRVNSPGGTIGAVQELYKAVLRFKAKKKPVVVSMGDIATSGGYYISLPADKIVANPGTITGSIGVIVNSPAIYRLFNKIGISYRVFKSGKHKDILSPYREITDEEKKLIYGIVESAYNQFYEAVKINRHIPDEKLKIIADGRIFTGKQALKYKLIDEIGDFKDAISIAGKLAGLGENPPIIDEKIIKWEDLIRYFSYRFSKLIKFSFSPVEFKTVPVYYLYIP